MKTKIEQLLSLIRSHGMVRPRDLDGHDIPRMALTRLHRAGLLDRPSRGVYVLANAEATENHDLAEACKRVPRGVVCLLSALRFHGLTTQAPFEVWLAIDRKARLPRVEHPRLRIVRFPAHAAGGRCRGTRNRGRDGAGHDPSADGRGLLRLPQQGRPGCGPGSPARLLAAEAGDDGRVTPQPPQSRRMANVMRPYLESLA